MTHRIARTAALLFALSAVPSFPAALQDAAPPARPSGADQQAEALRTEDAQYVHSPIAWAEEVEDPAALRTELADLDVLRRTLGSGAYRHGSFLVRVTELRKQCAAVTPFEGQRELLRDAALLHAQAAMDAGERRAALEILREPAPRPTASDLTAGRALDAVPTEYAAVYLRAASDPLVLERRRAIVARLVAQGDRSDDEGILARKVAEALERQDWGTIHAIGGRALPYVVEAVKANWDGDLSEPKRDPLYGLLNLDRSLAAQAVLDMGGEQDDYMLRARVLNILRTSRILGSGDRTTWLTTFAPTRERGIPTCAIPGWLDVLAWILEEPDLVATALPLTEAALMFDALTPRLAERLATVIRESPSDARPTLVVGAENQLAGVKTSLPVLEALATSGSPSERVHAAELLATQPRNAVLMELTSSDTSELRRIAAKSRIAERYTEWTWWQSNWGYGIEQSLIATEIAPGDRERVRALLTDDDDGVRTTALEACIVHGWIRSDDIEQILARNSRSDDLTLLNSATRLPFPQQAALVDELLDRLAQDTEPDEKMVRALTLCIQELGSKEPQLLGTTLARFLALERPGFQAQRDRVILSLLRVRDGGRALIRAVSGLPDRELRKTLSERVMRIALSREPEVRGYGPLEQSVFTEVFTAIAQSDADALARVWARSAPHGSPRTDSGQRLATIVGLEAVHRRLALDPDAEFEARYWALSWLDSPAPELVRSVLAAVDTSRKNHRIHMLLRWLPPAERAAFQDALLADPGAAPELVAEALAYNVRANDPGKSARLGRALDWVLARPGGLDPGEVDELSSLSAALIDWLPLQPEIATTERVRKLFDLHDSSLSQRLFEALARVRNPAHVPVLERELETTTVFTRANTWMPAGILAAETLTSFLSEEAGEALARGLGSSDREVRKACSQGLGEIARMLEQREAWARRERSLPSREVWVGELVDLLEAESIAVRVEAIHALATAGAVETLPRLVRLVADPEPRVAAAAREALGRLREAERPAPAEDGDSGD